MDQKIKYRFKVDRDLCIPVMACVVAEPDVYELDDDGKAVVKSNLGLQELRELSRSGDWVVVESSVSTFERILDSAKVCPVLAIIVEKEVDGRWQRVYPR